MKKWILLAVLMTMPFLAPCQTIEQVKSDPAFLWGEGTGIRPSGADEAALEQLVRKLSLTKEIPLDVALWRTYLPDIKTVSGLLTSPSGVAFRYLALKDIPKIFENRWRKVRELAGSAERAAQRGETDIARTYCNWAEIYLSSLPQGEYALRRQVSELRARLGQGSVTALKMRNVEAETEAIRAALGATSVVRPAAQPEPKAVPAPPAPAKPVVMERKALPALPLPVIRFPSNLVYPASMPVFNSRRVAIQECPAPVVRLEPRVLPCVEVGRIPAYGVIAAGLYGRFGGYVSLRSNFRSGGSDYACTSDGKTDYGWMWADGKVSKARLSVSGGGVFRLSELLNLYAGAGYGSAAVLWQDTEGRWARVEDLSRKGLLLDAGVFVDIGKFTISLGASALGFSELSGVLGAGMRF